MAGIQRMIKSGIRLYNYKPRAFNFVASPINRFDASANSYRSLCSSSCGDGHSNLSNIKRTFNVNTSAAVNALKAKGVPVKHAKAVAQYLARWGKVDTLKGIPEKDLKAFRNFAEAKIKDLKYFKAILKDCEAIIKDLEAELKKGPAHWHHSTLISTLDSLRKNLKKIPHMSKYVIDLDQAIDNLTKEKMKEIRRSRMALVAEVVFILSFTAWFGQESPESQVQDTNTSSSFKIDNN